MFRKIDPDGGAGKFITISINGAAVEAEEGEPLAAVLLRRPPFTARTTPVSASPRAPYCLMGACFECLVEVDGVTSNRSCMIRVRSGMEVSLQDCRPDPLQDSRA